MVDPTIESKVRDYVQRLRARGMDVRHALLYGSQARGTARPDSDIDVLLLTGDANGDRYWSESNLAWEVADDVDWRIEPVLCGSRQYDEDDWHPLIDVAKREGIEIKV